MPSVVAFVRHSVRIVRGTGRIKDTAVMEMVISPYAPYDAAFHRYRDSPHERRLWSQGVGGRFDYLNAYSILKIPMLCSEYVLLGGVAHIVSSHDLRIAASQDGRCHFWLLGSETNLLRGSSGAAEMFALQERSDQ